MAVSRWSRFVVRPLFWLLALAALLALGLRIFLASSLAREKARDLLTARLSEGLGRAVTIAAVDFDVFPSALVVEGLTVAGDREGGPPFARLARGEIEIGLGAANASSLELRRVALSGLELALEFRADGTDNLPRPPRAGRRGLTVRVGTLSIDDSTVRLDEHTLPLALVAEAVGARLVGVGERGVEGSIAAQQVLVTLPQAMPFAAAVAARVRVDGERVEIRSARVAAPDLALVAHGEIDFGRPSRGELEIELDSSGRLLDRLGWLRGEIAGDLAFDGAARWEGREWTVDGRAASPALAVAGFGLADVEGSVRAERAGARLELRRGSWAEGALAGSLEVDFTPRYPARLALTIDGADLDAVLGRFAVPVRGVEGRLSGPFDYAFELREATRGSGHGELTIAGEQDGEHYVEARGEVGVALEGGMATVAPLSWSARGLAVDGGGRFALDTGAGEVGLHVTSEDLGGLARRLPFLDPEALWLPSSGTGEIDLELALAGERFTAEIGFAAAMLESPGLAAARAAGRARADERGLEIVELELEDEGARLAVTGALPYDEHAAMTLRVVADGWPIARAAPWLPFALPLSGSARGELRLAGSAAAPTGELEAVAAPVEVAGLLAERLAVALEWNAERLAVGAARLDFEAGGIEGRGTLRFADEALDFVLESPALALDGAPLSGLGKGALTGRLRLAAEIGGTLSAPRLELRADSSDAQLAGESVDAAGGTSLRATWAGGELDAELRLGDALRVDGGGRLALGAASRLEFRLASERLDRLLALAAGGTLTGLEGALEARLEAAVATDGAVEIELEVPQLEAAWRGRRIRSLEPVRARFDERGLTVESFYLALGEAESEIFVGGRVGPEADPALDLHVQAGLPASWVGAWLGDTELAGALDLLATVRGTLSRPAWSGQGSWHDGRYIPTFLPHSVERADALVLLYPQAVVLDRLTGELGGGTLSASGRVDLRQGEVSGYRFEAAARRLALRWPPGWQLRGDADLTLFSTAAGRQIAGQVELDRAYYFQDIDLSPAQLLQRLLARGRVVVPETDELLATTALNVGVSAPGTVRIRNNLAELTATADLAVRGSLARPVVFGEVRAEPGSRALYGGNRYDVERGVLAFTDPTRIDPRLDIVAATRIDQYDVKVNVGGSLSRPLTSFSADPPLPDLEILGLLTTGRAAEPSLASGSAAGADAQRSAAAEALLYGQAASLVGQRVGTLFGFDQVRVEPLTSGDVVSAARVTVGKRLSRKLFVTYSYDPSSTAQQILQVEWRLSDQLVLVMTQNGNESYSVDARWESSF